MKQNRFNGQAAIVTGGATGLGLAIARRIASEGGTIAIVDRDVNRLQDALRVIAQDGYTAHSFAADIADEASVFKVVGEVENGLGPVSVMVNSAGIVGPNNTKIVDYPAAEFDRIYAINLRGAFLMTKAVLPSMLHQNYGRILLIASIAGKDGNPGMCGYSATKVSRGAPKPARAGRSKPADAVTHIPHPFDLFQLFLTLSAFA